MFTYEMDADEAETKKAEEEMLKYFRDSKEKSMSAPTEIEFSKLLDTCVVIMNKYVDSHSGLVGIYDQLKYFYDKFLQLANLNIDFLRALTEKTDEGLVDVEQIKELVQSQQEIMQELSKMKTSLSSEYGVDLSQEAVIDMKSQLQKILKTVNSKSVQDFEVNFRDIHKAKGLPGSGIVKLQDKLYRYKLDSSTDNFEINELE
jgi:hypothetical protein